MKLKNRLSVSTDDIRKERERIERKLKELEKEAQSLIESRAKKIDEFSKGLIESQALKDNDKFVNSLERELERLRRACLHRSSAKIVLGNHLCPDCGEIM